MKGYYVSIGGSYFAVFGCEAAYAAYEAACDFGEILGLTVNLIDSETGEVLAYNQDDEFKLNFLE